MLNRLRLWFYGLLIRRAFVALSRQRRLRATHGFGAGAAGRVRIVESPTFPAHPFFTPGREFPLRLRHATLQFEDAALDIRSASLKFSDQARESPFDLIMNTGVASAFWNVPSFLAFVKAKRRGKAALRAWSEEYPRGKEAAIGALRRAPESFSRLHYYAQLVFAFHASDGRPRYVKYRLVPRDDGLESGLPSTQDLVHPWDQERLPEEQRPKDYLRTELRTRLAQASVTYRLQLQLRDAVPGEAREIFDSSLPWDEAVHPWQDLATVTLERPLTDDETEKLAFNVAHQPDSLGLLPATSPEDFNSLGVLRRNTYPAAQKGRNA